MNKLFIIDALALAHRYYWVHKELRSSDGQFTGMAYGAAVFIKNLIERQEPTHLVVATDIGGQTFRHELYPEYKATRKKKDSDFKQSLKLYYELFKQLKIPIVAFQGYEADDVIGSLAKKFDQPNLLKFIISGDKDFMQLVDQNTYLYRPEKKSKIDLVTLTKVEEKLGIMPNQVIDYLSLVGDKADNIPGAYGIGEKGAVKLLKSFGTLDNIYNNLDLIKGKKTANNLINSKDSAYLSKQLATIKTDLPIKLKFEETQVDTNILKSQELLSFYKNLEFNSLLTS